MNKTHILATLILGLPIACGLARASDNGKSGALAPIITYADTPESFEKALIAACQDAKADYRRGQAKYVVTGLPSAKARLLADFLRQHYEITPDFRGCIASDSNHAYADAYNKMICLLFLTERNVDLEMEGKEFLQNEKKPNPSPEPTVSGRVSS